MTNKFNATTAVESLEYDFTAFGGSRGPLVEPSTKQIDRYRRDVISATRKVVARIQELRGQAEGKDKGRKRKNDAEVDDADLGVVMDALSDEALDVNEPMAHAISEMFSGTPSADEILNLPGRVQAAFTGWVNDLFLSPEALRPATKN